MGALKAHMDMTWDIARKLVKLSDDEQRKKIFGYSDVSRIIKNYSAIIVDSRINQYEKEKKEEKVCVGDICFFATNPCPCIVFNITEKECEEDIYTLLFVEGNMVQVPRQEIKRTGKNVDILRTLRGMAFL